MDAKTTNTADSLPRTEIVSPNLIGGLLQKAIQHHQEGNVVVAETVYNQVLQLDPEQPDALHLMGVIRHQTGDHRAAIDLIKRSVKRKSSNADAYSNLGAAQAAAGDLAAAAKSFGRALKINPDFVDAHANLAAVSVRRGADQEAIESFRTAHELRPAEPRFMNRLADLYLKHDQFADAIEWFERYLDVSPDDVDARNNMAFACDKLHRLEEAEAHYRKAFEIDPNKPEIANNLASVLRRQQKEDEARQLFDRALQMDPSQWEDKSNYAGALFNDGQWERALEIFETLAQQRPDESDIHRDYGIALVRSGNVEGAETAFRRAVELSPDQDATRIEFAHCLLRLKKTEEAAEILLSIPSGSPHYLAACLDLCLVYSGSDQLEKACDVARTAVAHPNFRSTMYIKPYSVFRTACDFDAIESIPGSLSEVDDQDLSVWVSLAVELFAAVDTSEKMTDLTALNRRWGEQTVRDSAGGAFIHAPAALRSGPVRLGFLSSDLKAHSVARFVLPLFQHHDRDQFEIYCYAPEIDADDEVQNRLRREIKEFQVVENASYFDVAQRIHDDNIDILLELNGFTDGSRLNALAYRPAPVQICWLGYPGTTGLPTVDYILLDKYNVPEQPDWLVEEPLVMPGCWVCYDAFEQTAVTPEPPVTRNGVVTFGTLNNPYKFTRQAVALWADVMRKVPNSRFLSVHPGHKAPIIAANLVKEFGQHGIAADRLSFVNNREQDISHFLYYEEIDISLDTMPLTGGTTSADSLWCGVPVVSLVGPALHQRLSYSLLNNVGAEELCAQTPEQFVAIATSLAGDADALRGYRRNLRSAIQDSSFGNGARYADDFQSVMREVVAKHNLR